MTSSLTLDEPQHNRNFRVGGDSQGSSLDLGNDRIDYKPSTIPTHHQRYINDKNSFKLSSDILDESILPVPTQSRLVRWFVILVVLEQ